MARIPPHVSDDQFRAYFAQFGVVQVSYSGPQAHRYTARLRLRPMILLIMSKSASSWSYLQDKHGRGPAIVCTRVTEVTLRCAQDAYMPKDASKLGHRGIGFVTFASPDAVEMVSERAVHCSSGRGCSRLQQPQTLWELFQLWWRVGRYAQDSSAMQMSSSGCCLPLAGDVDAACAKWPGAGHRSGDA